MILLLVRSAGASQIQFRVPSLTSRTGFFFFFTCQGRVYALTILGNFLFGIPVRNRTETTPTRFSNFQLSVVIDIPDTVMTQNSPPSRLASRVDPLYAPTVPTNTASRLAERRN
jgi:hypothetical protein